MVTLASGACGQPVQWSVVGDIHGKRSTEGQEPLRCVTQGACVADGERGEAGAPGPRGRGDAGTRGHPGRGDAGTRGHRDAGAPGRGDAGQGAETGPAPGAWG